MTIPGDAVEGLADLAFLTWRGLLLGEEGVDLLEQARAGARSAKDPGERALFTALVEELIASSDPGRRSA